MRMKNFLSSGFAHVGSKIKSSYLCIFVTNRLTAQQGKFMHRLAFIGRGFENVCNMPFRNNQCV